MLGGPWVLGGPIDGETFKAWVEAALPATLKPGGIAVLDDPGSHKTRNVRAMTGKAGARLFLPPPYRPDLDPIAPLFPKIKPALPKAMGRTVEAVQDALAALLETIPPSPCQNRLANPAYHASGPRC